MIDQKEIQTKTVGDLVAKDYRAAGVFKQYGIDFCCGGKKTVAEVCNQKGVPMAELEEKLAHLEGRPARQRLQFNEWALPFLIDYIINMLLLIPVFWLHSERGMNSIYFSLSHTSENPHQIYTGWTRRLLTTIVPLALISSFPTHILFEGLSLERALHTAIVTAAFFALLIIVWRQGLRAYSSASS